MCKVLVLGAGLVAKPMIEYFVNHKYNVIIASKYFEKSIIGIANKNNDIIKLKDWDVSQEDVLDSMIADSNIVISLLPYVYHPYVAKYCIKNKKNMITASYVKEEMMVLDNDAKKAGISILNELGLDPGIDHLSAMKIIDEVHSKGGNIEEFYSFCGALPSPESIDNPFKYKFSWSPRGVLLAGNNNAKYLKDGKIVEINTINLFKNPIEIDYNGIGSLEVYPNRDSLSYINVYGISEANTVMRGTFRYQGWCEIMDGFKRLNLLNDKKYNVKGRKYSEFIAMLVGLDNNNDIKFKLCNYLNVTENSLIISALEWLGLLGDKIITEEEISSFDLLSNIMIEKMMLGQTDKDMIIMLHTFVVSYDGIKKVIKSSLVDFGSQETNTAIARTVSLPVAIATRLILENKINRLGVILPIYPDIYMPILEELDTMGISMKEIVVSGEDKGF